MRHVVKSTPPKCETNPSDCHPLQVQKDMALAIWVANKEKPSLWRARHVRNTVSIKCCTQRFLSLNKFLLPSNIIPQFLDFNGINLRIILMFGRYCIPMQRHTWSITFATAISSPPGKPQNQTEATKEKQITAHELRVVAKAKSALSYESVKCFCTYK